MQKQFQQCEDRYACVSDDESINLLFRIYDDYMEEKGICIAKISREAVNVLLGEGIDYSDCTWMVLFGDDRIIAFQGRWSEIEQLTEFESVWRGKRLLKEHNVIGCAKMCGFDIRTVICVGEEIFFCLEIHSFDICCGADHSADCHCTCCVRIELPLYTSGNQND